MRRGALPVLGWAAFLTALTVLLFVWAPHAPLEWGLFAGAAAVTWAVGIAILVRGSRVVSRAPVARTGGAVTFAAGVVLAANALVFGWWLAVVGAGFAAAGSVLLVREARP